MEDYFPEYARSTTEGESDYFAGYARYPTEGELDQSDARLTLILLAETVSAVNFL